MRNDPVRSADREPDRPALNRKIAIHRNGTEPLDREAAADNQPRTRAIGQIVSGIVDAIGTQDFSRYTRPPIEGRPCGAGGTRERCLHLPDFGLTDIPKDQRSVQTRREPVRNADVEAAMGLIRIVERRREPESTSSETRAQAKPERIISNPTGQSISLVSE